MDRVRIGILGAGHMGGRHARNLAARGEATGDVRVAGVYSVPRSGAAELAASVEADVFDDLESMIAAVDAVVVALPPDAHAGQVERIVARGRHVFVEKPIARTARAARAMAHAAEAAGVFAQVGFHFRFLEPVRRLRERAATEGLGRSAWFAATYRCRALHGPWWRDSARSGGQRLEQAIHLIDLAAHLMGPVARVGAVAANRLHAEVPGYSIEDVGAGWMEFADGALGTLTNTNAAVPTRWDATASAGWDYGVWDLAPDGCARFWATGGRDAEAWFADGAAPTPEDWPAGTDPYAAEIAHFVEGVRGGTANLAPLRDGATATAVAEAFVRSSAGGGAPIAVENLFP